LRREFQIPLPETSDSAKWNARCEEPAVPGEAASGNFSSGRKCGNPTNAGNFTAGEIPERIAQFLLRFPERFNLCKAIRDFLEASGPHLTVLPADVRKGENPGFSIGDGGSRRFERTAATDPAGVGKMNHDGINRDGAVEGTAMENQIYPSLRSLRRLRDGKQQPEPSIAGHYSL
jgi:hypothetical protein